jgi:cytochrome c peroxidase
MKRLLVVSLAAAAALTFASAAGAALTPIEQLGKAIYFDNLSSPDRQACADCHAPRSGWTGPVGGINQHGAVYRGAVPQRFGNRKPPSAAYATTAPLFHWDSGEELFVGGNFWDGRATGDRLGNPAADQALGPFLNPVEMNNASKLDVLKQIAKSRYSSLWFQVWGTPVRLAGAAAIEQDYDRVGLAIAAFEASPEVNAYTSKFDYVERGMAEFTPQEAWGREVFEGKANCAACHMAPLFTDYTFDNLGTPKNPENPFYGEDQVFLDNGEPINPAGASWVDLGLGGFLATLPGSYFSGLGLDKLTAVGENLGKQKVPTLRNVDLRPSDTFPKAYMHNGALKSLKEVVHFYNTRDVESWPPPEVAENVNHDELGNLGLTNDEEDAVVAFMMTLSDGYVPTPMAPAMMATHEAVGTSPPTGVLRVRYLAPGRYQFSYHLAVDSNVEMTMFDVTGRRVASLGSGLQAAGDRSVDWSSGSLPNGIYLVHLRVGPTQITSKLVVAH